MSLFPKKKKQTHPQPHRMGKTVLTVGQVKNDKMNGTSK